MVSSAACVDIGATAYHHGWVKKPFHRKSISISAALYEALDDHCSQNGVAIAGLVEATMRERLGMTPTVPKKRIDSRKPLRVVNGTCLITGKVSSFSVAPDGSVEEIALSH